MLYNKMFINLMKRLCLGSILSGVFITNSFAGDTGYVTAAVYLPVAPTESLVFVVEHRGHQCMWSPRSSVSEVQHATIVVDKKGMNISRIKFFTEPKNSSSDGDTCNTDQNLSDYSIHGIGVASTYSASGTLRWHSPVFSHDYISLENSGALQICGSPNLCGSKELQTPSSHGDNYIIFTPMGG